MMDKPFVAIAKLSNPRRRWLQFRLRSLLLLATSLSVPLSWLGHRMELVRRAHANDLTRRYQAAEKLRQTIRAEIQSLGDHEWAGEYGNGFGISVMLAPKSGFAYAVHGCCGLVDVNHGYVDEYAGKLCLTFIFQNERHVLDDVLIPVAWGPRRYLIANDKMIDFCNAVNGDGFARMSTLSLLTCRDESKVPVGLPTVPEEFERYLLSQPVETEIIGVGTRSEERAVVNLNRGKKHGLLPGMELYVVDPADVQLAKITRVDEEQAEAIIERILGDEPPPQVGWKLSTRW